MEFFPTYFFSLLVASYTFICCVISSAIIMNNVNNMKFSNLHYAVKGFTKHFLICCRMLVIISLCLLLVVSCFSGLASIIQLHIDLCWLRYSLFLNTGVSEMADAVLLHYSSTYLRLLHLLQFLCMYRFCVSSSFMSQSSIHVFSIPCYNSICYPLAAFAQIKMK